LARELRSFRLRRRPSAPAGPRQRMSKAAELRKRAPSAAVARAKIAAKRRRVDARGRAESTEARHRRAGGYGRPMVSCWDVPKGGIKSSPAYRKVLARCGGGPLPAPQDRAGAAVKGGYPIGKWPPNLMVDAKREPWLPDEWAQAIKNTGPGGVYIGWVSPEGKFFYHRRGYPTAIEEASFGGRELTALDGFNGIMRAVTSRVDPKKDQAFLRGCLTRQERQEVVGAGQFHFAVVSARRASHEDGIADIMVVEAQFRAVGVRPTWYVDAESLADYRKLGLDALVGGKLCPARNMALDVASKRRQVCVQVSDDIGKWLYYDVEKQSFAGEVTMEKANLAEKGSTIYQISPLAAAQYLLAKMRSSEAKPKLGGVYPQSNPAIALGLQEYGTRHFILGDFFVADASPCRFDEELTLKEDYDYTCGHLQAHGSVLRCNRLFVFAKHRSNAGGAVDARDAQGEKERANIRALQRKWPGVFKENCRRTGWEVLMNWGSRAEAAEEPARSDACAAREAAIPTSPKVRATRSKAGATREAATPASPRKTLVARKASKKPARLPAGLPAPGARLSWTGKVSAAAHITARCKKFSGRAVRDVVGVLQVMDAGGHLRTYRSGDLGYDLARGFLSAKGR